MIVFITIFILFSLIGFYTVVDSIKKLIIKLVNKNNNIGSAEDVESQRIS